MCNLTLGIDLGTNSIGWAIRDTTENDNQIIKNGVLIFDKGVGEEKGIEFPKVKKRTESRGKRRNYQAEKYRKWELLEFLIQNEMCPLSIDELNEWRKYSKKDKRKYPQTEKFLNWLRFDFNGDGKPDFHLLGGDKHESYYLFRMKAVSEEEKDKKVLQENPQILGRVFYHLVQRRGFKGRDEEEAKTMLQGSKDGTTKGRNEISEYIDIYKSLGAALYHYQKEHSKNYEKVRIRQRYNLRKDYENELKEICRVQGLSDSDYKKLQKAIIWQRPLRTQKGLIGLCTYERNKRRAPISHPLYEEYRTWIFINNLKIEAPEGEALDAYLKEKIYPLFLKSGTDFKLKTILDRINKDGGKVHSKFADRPDTKVLSAKLLKKLEEVLGESWKEDFNWNAFFVREAQPSKKQDEVYTVEDIWHILFTFDNEEKLKEFASTKLGLSEEASTKFSKIKLQQGYASLSPSAIKKILPYLQKGFLYPKAVYMANLQKVLGTYEVSEDLINHFASEIDTIYENAATEKKLNNILNSLFRTELVLEGDYHLAEHEDLDDADLDLIKQKIIEILGEKTWSETDEITQKQHFDYVRKQYKQFLQKPLQAKKAGFIEQPRIHDQIFKYLQEHYPEQVPHENIKYLWHPSEQEKYPNASTYQEINLKSKTFFIKEAELDRFLHKNPDAEAEGISLELLGDPEPISKGFKNPMALKTLHKLKQLLNFLLHTQQIDKHTRIVVEIARELNNANYRKALEKWQSERERENESYKKRITEINKECNTSFDINNKSLIRKIRLWEEQDRKCLYTGEVINMCDVLNGEYYDIEHTIPASISFDSELKNLSLANKDFNNNIKGKKYPTQLDNYDDASTFNGKRIEPIIKNIESLFGKRTVYKKKVKKGGVEKEITVEKWAKIADLEKKLDGLKNLSYIDSKDAKDYKIQQRHLLKFKLDYLKQKLQTFTIEEYKASWRNSQLRDTQIMTKYAVPYLKTVFNRVEVQKGNVVNDFKEIYNVKLFGNKKDRTKHSHHAVDAAILTLIPKPTERDQILTKYNLAKDNGIARTYHEQPIDWKDFKTYYIKQIEEETLINNLKEQRTLTSTFKKVRKRGKIVKKENGKPIWAKGDTIRGQLHGESLYGAIKQAQRDEDNKIVFDDNKKMILEEEIKLVIRKPLTYAKDAASPGFKTLKEIEKVIVDRALFEMIQTQVDKAESFKNALEKGIYMLNKKGGKVNKIRHIRCFDRLKHSTAVRPHDHDFVSDKEYKQTTYAQNGENVFCLFYKGEVKGKEERAINVIGIFDLAKLDIKDEKDFYKIPLFNSINKKKTELPLYAVLKSGQKAIFYKENLEELKDLNEKELSNRMYKMYQFEQGKGGDKIKFKHHLISGANTEIVNGLPKGYKEASEYGCFDEQPLMRLTAGNWNFAIENQDFEMNLDGKVKF
ncbi:type II CRISPR RNA-guided endonuclease Cas9 [Leeuwenhoekiella polynyae]|uniref:CRISPR-associated endonuclease Csn1 n=1 Tax=Leeuwenhoekiella polynyae TaxID=1550906 RepID=A0A4Q0P2A4_9FLAO|nr:type II CRISPR RNA-guided endonuclease Cas9 [Leeuwenhoekiella polynyae]RXG20345.1 CRISPR-associated endonuclease Csn1 [Leeuwenhoekiella polynyae]